MLICQLEMKVRDIFSRDTKSFSIPTLTDYLQYYCGWAAAKNKKSSSHNLYGKQYVMKLKDILILILF